MEREFPEINNIDQFRRGTIRLAHVMSPPEVEIYREAFEKPGAATAAVNYYRELVKEIPSGRHLRVRPISCPVRVLWGRRDVALDPVVNDIAAGWSENMEVFYFPRCWHWLASEKPRAVTQHLLRFFNS